MFSYNASHKGGLAARLTGILFVVMGLALLAGGGWLLGLGGSGYFVLAGAGFALAGLWLYQDRGAALWLYALVLIASLGWTIWDTGMDFWQLLTRCGLLALVGIWLILLPYLGRRRPVWPQSLRASRGGQLALTLTIGVCAAASVMAYQTPLHDIAGQLPAAPLSVAAAAARPDAPATAVPVSASVDAQRVPPGEWRAYGRDAFGRRYSPLAQINTANAASLQQAWEFHTGDVRSASDVEETTYEVTPLKVDDMVYLCTPHDLVIALDAATGRERWRYDPKVPPGRGRQHQTCRGLSFHERTDLAPGLACAQRLFMPTADARLIALDAKSGAVCRDFAKNGELALWANMPNVNAGFYYSTSPPVVTRDLIVIGGAVNDNVSTHEPSGVVRAYDVNTGALKWNWDAKRPQDTQPIAEGATYSANSPNVWSTMSVDEDLRMVYLPMGNSPPDQWGGRRDAMTEKFSSSITALSLDTGQVKWVFQTVHHDLWDMDVPAQPSLIDLDIDGTRTPALVQATKQGDIYVLDRRTGAPLLPVTEAPAPQGAAAGDRAAPTQPYSALSFQPARLRESDMWGASIFDQLACRIAFRRLRYEGRYTPPSTQGSLIYPGNFGTFNWGGVAVDPRRQALFAMPVYLAFVSKLVPRGDASTSYVSKGPPGLNENYGAPFAVELKPFMSPIGLPCQAPPWGYVAGASLRDGKIAWEHKNGTVRDLSPLPLPFEMGVPGIGGPIMTAGGVAFLSGSLDNYVRAYDVTDGHKLWQARLPAGGQATPMTYEQNGRQYVLVVAGGHGSTGTKKGDAVIAYALPAS